MLLKEEMFNKRESRLYLEKGKREVVIIASELY